MKLLGKIIILILSNAIALFVAVKIVNGIEMDSTLMNYVIAGALLGVVNTFLRPILKLFSFPFIILSLGLFTIIINIVLLFLVSFLFPAFVIESITAAFWGVLIISVVNYLISIFTDN